MSPTPFVRRAPATPRWVLACALVISFTAVPATASAQAVKSWNEIAIAQISAGHPGPAGVFDVAAVQAAVHDAVQAYAQTHHPYAMDIENATGSQAAAVATAARDVLMARLPAAQAAATLTAWQNYLTGLGIPLDDPGVAVGSAAAAGVLALRLNDGSFPAVFPAFNGANQVGVWRPTPPGFLTMAAPWASDVVPFTASSTAGFQPEPPPSLTSAAYAEAYNEVKSRGASTSPRTAAENHLVRFYTDNFLAQWNRVLRGVITDYGLDEAGAARLLALANLSSADAFISVWQAKKFYSLWRPITAIREGEADGNAQTIGDPTWTPAVTTPNYPDYTSGANSLAGAITRTLALFFGSDHLPITMSSASSALLAGDATTIAYQRFSDVAKDIVEVRILQGIHFRFADTESRSQGRRVANHAFRDVLVPRDQPGRWR